VHTQGCRRWFNAIRHTVTHEIAATYKIGEPLPPPPAGRAR
jgi:sarcosine oxidase delta subunit